MQKKQIYDPSLRLVITPYPVAQAVFSLIGWAILPVFWVAAFAVSEIAVAPPEALVAPL